jgi:hypothetical protein
MGADLKRLPMPRARETCDVLDWGEALVPVTLVSRMVV